MQDDIVFELYKPLRNHLKQVPLMDSLAVVRAYVQYLQFNQPLPKDIQVDPAFLRATSGPEKKIYEWELDIIAKEIILHSESSASKTLKQWDCFTGAINKLKDLENNISVHYKDLFSKNILLELYRLSHRQFPWQRRPNSSSMTRYYKIFSQPEIDDIIQKNIGLTAKELYIIGVALTGVYLEYFALFYPPDLQIVEITKEKLDKFLEHFSADLSVMKEDIRGAQSYNQDYAYSLNPLKIRPLIKTTYVGKDSLICPVPTFLFKRFTEGVYYEICKDPNFANPFGQSFQKFIGEVIEKANTSNRYKIFAESEYRIGKERKDTVDWIVIDGDCNLFVECKTKKLRAGAKIAIIDNTVLQEDLDLMADFIVQVYRTIIDYQKGYYPKLKNNNKSIFPLIVTLEDWFAFGDEIISAIDNRVMERLKLEGINESVMQEMPYSICCAEDFERVIQVINFAGIKPLMSKKTTGEKRLWVFESVINNDFREENTKTENLFPEDTKSITTGIIKPK